MSFEDEILAGIPGDEKPLSRHTRRAAELLRLPGTAERWCQQCLESFQESQQRNNEHEAWMRDRKDYATKHFPQDEASNSPGDGWTWGRERLFSNDRTESWCVMGWLPPMLGAHREPFAGPLLPFSSLHQPTLADCYFVLAAVHDAERQGAGKIRPFETGEGGDRAFYACMTKVDRLSESDRLTLDDCLHRVEADLRMNGFANDGAPLAVADEQEIRPADGPTMDEMAAMMSIAVDENSLAILKVAQDPTKSADQKMRANYAIDSRFLGKTSVEWATLLGVSEAAIRQTDWWKNDRNSLRG